MTQNHYFKRFNYTECVGANINKILKIILQLNHRKSGIFLRMILRLWRMSEFVLRILIEFEWKGALRSLIHFK